MKRISLLCVLVLLLVLFGSCSKEDSTEVLTAINATVVINQTSTIEIQEGNIYTVYGRTHKSADPEKFRIAIQNDSAYFFDDKVLNDWIILNPDRGSGLGGVLNTYVSNGDYDFEDFLPQDSRNNYLTLKNRTTGFIRIVKFVVDFGEILKTPSNSNREVPFKRVFFSNPAAVPYQFPGDMTKFNNGFILGIPEIGQAHQGDVYLIKNMNQRSPKLLNSGFFNGFSGIERIAFNDLGGGDFIGVVAFYGTDGSLYSGQFGLSPEQQFYGDNAQQVPIGSLTTISDLVFENGQFVAESDTANYCTSANTDLSWSDCDGCQENCENIIYIDDTDLQNIYHHQETYEEPTVIVYRNLTSLPGYIYLHQNVNIKEIRVPNLETVGEYLYLNQNVDFEAVDIPNLTSVGEHLYISGNESLGGVSFPLLTSINSNGQSTNSIGGNTLMTEFDIPGLATLGGSLSFSGNPLIDELSFPLLTSVSGFLNINGNDSLANIHLPLVTSIGTDDGGTYQLYLPGNPQLTTVDLNSLESVYGYIYVTGDNSLQQLSLPELSNEIDYMYIANNENLESVLMPNLIGAKEDISFHINASMTTIDLSSVQTVGEDLYFHQNGIEAVSMPALQSISGQLYFHQNLDLQTIGLPNLISTGGYAYFAGNSSLTQLDVSQMTSVGNAQNENSYLYLTGNTSLGSLSADMLTEIYGYLYVAGNSALDMSNTLCNLTNIYAIDDGFDCRDAYATVSGNANNTVCFTATIETCN
nr:leucine-rich repeat protein [Allomuricauda sp.]